MTSRRWGDRQGTLVIGHRGASALALENTIAAFRRARADGADGVELDIIPCKTGELVVFHDDDLSRLAGRKERIVDLPLAEIAEVRLEGGERIPLLDDVLDEIGPLLCNVELKANAGVGGVVPALRLARDAARLISRRDTSTILVSSFHPFALAEFKRRAPRVATGLLFGANQARPLREAWAAKVVRPMALHPEHVLVDAGRLAAWRKRGAAVHVWTVNERPEVARLDSLGVDGIICNDPGQVRGWLAA
jgi:glycerophosphoryl diester phosphodiesterase